MKAFLLTTDNGLAYEDHAWWVTAVFLVPDDWDEIADLRAFFAQQGALGAFRLIKDGWPYRNDRPKADALYEADLRARFESIPFIGGGTPS